jgi:adenosylhomocysteine nucleosidase
MGLRFALVAALEEELRTLLASLDSPVTEHHAGRAFHRGHLDGHEVVLVRSGIGKVAAATTALLLADRYGVDALVFTGVAGALQPTASIGDVVVARELLQHDMDASPLFPRHEVPLTGRSRFPTDADLSDALARAASDALDVERIGLDSSFAALGIDRPRVHEGLVVSGDRFVATALERTALRTELPDALAVEMEGAAVAQVCLDCDLPFAVLRTLSDCADDSAHVDFRRFVAEVAGPLGAAIVRTWLRRVEPA